MLTFKKELDTTELIKWVAVSVGAVVAFFIISLNEASNDNERMALETAEANRDIAKAKREIAKAKKEAFETVAAYRPRIIVYYTNMLSEDNKELLVRVHLEIKSAYDLYMKIPTIALYDKNEEKIDSRRYKSDDITSFSGLFSPGAKYHVNYTLSLDDLNSNDLGMISLIFEVEMDELIASSLQEYLKAFEDEHVDEWANRVARKEFKYKEKIYSYNENPIWSDFWSNPR